jgi:serpin B
MRANLDRKESAGQGNRSWKSMASCLGDSLAPLRGAVAFLTDFRWCRFAKPPANRWQASGLQALTKKLVALIALTASLLGKHMPAMASSNPADAQIVQGNTAFALDLYAREKGNAGNLFFSPYSISTALAMTYAGARGDTAEQMAKALRFGLPPQELPAAFPGVARRMDEIGRGGQVSLSVANSLWCQKDHPFMPAFLKLNRDFYGAEARLVDFIANPEAARSEINSWIAGKTADKIPELLQRGDLSGRTRMVLCNAIYFKGKWASQFESHATQPAPFFVAPGQPVQVPMMFQKLKLQSHDLGDSYVIVLPYVGKELSMVIVLPKSPDGLGAVEQRLDGAKLGEALSALDAGPEAKAEVYLPRFKLSRRLDLSRELSAMGMPAAFGPEADFSGIDGRRDLVISAVVHQAVVDVNEEGTEAAAATAVTMRAMAVMREMTPVFRMDHPFLFLIREKQSGSILFLGRVANPAA